MLTTADLLLSNKEVVDESQVMVLRELSRFLRHESTGVKGFDRMPSEWVELNKLVSTGGHIPAKSAAASAVLEGWHQETKNLALILSRRTETTVNEKLSRKHANNPAARHKDEYHRLRDRNQLFVALDIPDAAARLDIIADISRRTIDVGMTLRAPEDRKSSKARVNWLLRQLNGEQPEDLQIRLNWPGRSEATQFSHASLSENPGIVENGKSGLQVSSFHIFISRRIAARFTQRANFIVDLEALVPSYYGDIGQKLSKWHRRPPKINSGTEDKGPVSDEGVKPKENCIGVEDLDHNGN